MARVAGVDLPREKRGEIAVTYIYGIGKPTAISVLRKANVDPNKRVKAWSDEETARVRERLAHGTDRQRLLSRGGLVGSARACSPAARAPLALALRPALRALRSGLWRAGCHQRT